MSSRPTHLQLQGDAADGAPLDALHEVLRSAKNAGKQSASAVVHIIRGTSSTQPPLPTHGGEAGNLVAQPLGLDDRHLLADALVGVEVLGQAPIVLLNDDTGSLLDGLGADATLS